MPKLSESDVVLVLTGCVIPNCNDGLIISDYNIRYSQYKKSIKWYLENTSFKIIFCENSGVDFSKEFIQYKANRIECLTYISPDEGQDRSKGYKEMEILEYAYKHSAFIKEGRLFVKITGRLILLNIVPMINYFLYKKKDSFISAYQNSTRPFSDCKFIFFTSEFWPILLSYKEKIWPYNNFECITYKAINDAKKAGMSFIYPPYLDRVNGIGGGNGISYNLSHQQYLFQNIKHQIRRLLFKMKILPQIIR